MNHSKVQKFMATIIGVLTIVVIIFSVNYYKGVKEEEQQWKTFINQLYFSIHHSITRIDFLIENEPEDEILDEVIRNLENELLVADTIVSSAKSYLDNEIYGTQFFRHATRFFHGINMTVRVK